MRKVLPFLAILIPSSLFALSYDSGSGGAGSDQGDILSGSTANSIMYTNGSKAITTTTLLKFDGTNVGIGLTTPAFPLDVTGNVRLSSVSVVDAYNSSFGAVTAASTSTLTWTEVTDRLGEFVTSSFTATMAGYYQVIAEAGAAQTAGSGCLLLKVNGTTIAGGNVCTTGVTALASVLTLSENRILNLSANDIVRIDGSATTANVTFQNMTLTINRIP